jgi:hypothetical protein
MLVLACAPRSQTEHADRSALIVNQGLAGGDETSLYFEMQSTLRYRRSAVARVLLFATLFVLGWMNFVHPTIRLADPPSNYAVFLLVLTLPGVVLWTARVIRPIWARVVVMALVAPVAAGCSLFGILVFGELATVAEHGVDVGHVPLGAFTSGRSRIVTYRNGAALSADGLGIRRELTFFPGMFLVDDVYAIYPAEDATVVPGPGNTIIVNGGCQVVIRERWFDHLRWPFTAPAPARSLRSVPPCR